MIDERLSKAVMAGKLEIVKELLADGVAVNGRISDTDSNTLLHHSSNVEIVKELIKYGANVNATNIYGYDAPLRYAVRDNKHVDIVTELLKHNADVNRKDNQHNTPLNVAVRKRRVHNLPIIKELLNYGADITIENREGLAPLDNAIGLYHLDSAKLLIQYTLIKNHNRILDKKKYINNDYREKLSCYWDNCISEIAEMKDDKINNKVSVYCILCRVKDANKVASHTKMEKLSDQVITKKYPCYKDLIIEKLEYGRKREQLLNELDQITVYEKSKQSESSHEIKEVTLDSGCKRNIAKYLSNNDLLNLIATGNDLDTAGQSSTQQPKIIADIPDEIKRRRLE